MKSLLALLLIFSSYSLFSQSTGDEIGTVSCELEIHSGLSKLDIRKKVLIQRAMAKARSSDYENESYGYGYAYTEWFLEFVSNTPITSRRKNSEENVTHRGKYSIQFLNKAGDILIKTHVGSDKLRLWQGKIESKPIYTYSLDLINLPLVIWDDVDAINIILIN